MSEVIISDFNRDTLVAFLLSKIFELLMEADQIGGDLRYGGMSLEDKEEFDRLIERSRIFIPINSLPNINAPVAGKRFG